MPATVPIGAFNEWGKLKEVLVGDSASFTFPRWSPDWGRYHGCKELLKGQEGVPLRVAFPERFQGILEQTNGLVRLLQNHGVVVHRPRLLTEAEMASGPVGLASQYARDPQLVIGNHL